MSVLGVRGKGLDEGMKQRRPTRLSRRGKKREEERTGGKWAEGFSLGRSLDAEGEGSRVDVVEEGDGQQQRVAAGRVRVVADVHKAAVHLLVHNVVRRPCCQRRREEDENKSKKKQKSRMGTTGEIPVFLTFTGLP